MGKQQVANALMHHALEQSFFENYERERLKCPARSDFIDGWQIDYVAFAKPETALNPPIVILGGAFQNFNSYKYCIDPLLATGPVILVDLPAMGSNEQTFNSHLDVSAKDLSMVQISELLSSWIASVGLEKISIMGMSLGSVVAANFAYNNPEKMHRLVLMGVMQRTRKSWRMLIEESLKVLDEQRMSEFGEAVVLYLVNHAKLDVTRMSSMALRMFHEQMAGFTYNEQLRYRINAHRLLNVVEVPSPSCPTLVATGQFDSFTLPHENARFARACDDGIYAMVENADHVPQLQRRRETLRLFTAFLANESIEALRGIRVLTDSDADALDRRAEPRVLVDDIFTLVNTKRLGWHESVTVHDMSFFGLYFEADTIEVASHIFAEARDIAIILTDAEGEFTIELLQFEQKGRKIRALFKHGSFANAERLKAYIANLTDAAELEQKIA